MKRITLSNGETVEVECLSCALTNGLVEPEGGVVIETEYFHAHQDVARIRKAQRTALGIEYVYYFYNEDTTHHFHTWMVPRYEWMYNFGRSVESVRPVLLHARNEMNTKENIVEVKEAITILTKELNK